MAKQKLLRFELLSQLKNVRQAPGELRGAWRPLFFHNQHPLTLELACGKGDYTVALAQRYRGRNFLGVDIKGPRLWVGATRALELGLDNAGFVRTAIEQLDDYFAPGEISEIWITFPDPHPTWGKRKKRLTSPRFLALYRRLLEPGGLIHLKTDDERLYFFTRETLQEEGAELLADWPDVDAAPADPDLTDIRTAYERRHREEGRIIRYLRFRLASPPATSP